MAVPLSSKPNTVAPGGAYPFGNIRNNDGSNNGTPVNTVVYGDLHQFFAALMFFAGIAYNNLPENGTNGFQYLNALIALIRATGASFTQQGTVKIATQAQVNAGISTGDMVAPATLKGFIDLPYTNDNTTTNWSFSGGTGTVSFIPNVNYKIIGKTLFVNYAVQFDINTNPVQLLRYTFPGLSRVGKLQINKSQFLLQGVNTSFESRVTINTDNPLTITFAYNKDGGSTQFPVAAVYLMQGEFTCEIV